MSTVSEVSDYITANAAGAGSVFDNAMPETPDVAVSVLEIPSIPSEKPFGRTGILYEYPWLLVTVRGAPYDHDGPRTRIQAIYLALANIETATLGATLYLRSSVKKPPYLLSTDDKDRKQFSIVVEMEKVPSA